MYFNRVQEKNGGHPKINIGVGIHTGPDARNNRRKNAYADDSYLGQCQPCLAARRAYQEIQTPIIVSEQTMKSAIDADDVLSAISAGHVKGKRKSVAIYEIFSGESQTYMEKKIQTKVQFEEALANFFDGRMGDAAKLFKAVLDKDAEDFAARIYLEKARGASK